MKKNSAPEPRAAADVDVELFKAVAQAWHAQSGNPRPSRASKAGGEDDAAGRHRAGRAARYRPSRFKLEAMAASAAAEAVPPREKTWDFARSLFDTYELVAVARRLESGLAIADHAHAAAAPPAVPREGDARGEGKRRKESGRSLRNLLLRSSSGRFA